VEEGWTEMARLQKEGKVRWIGVSNFSVAQMKRAAAFSPITSLQPPHSMLQRDVEAEILPYAREHGIGVIAYSPMASGLLTGTWTKERRESLPEDDWRKNKNLLFQDPAFDHGKAVAEVLREVGAAHGATPAAVAIAWVLEKPAVTAAIVGARAPGQYADIAEAAGLQLTASDRDRIAHALSAP